MISSWLRLRGAPQLRQRMTGVSWHRGCPVGFADLRLLRVTHWGFDGKVHRGRLVVHRNSARPILRTMRERAKGMVHRRGPVVKAFAKSGWEWGGNWSWPKDYQHFSAGGN